MYFLSAILARFNVGFRLGARKIPERVVAAASAESGGMTTGFGWPKAEENIRSQNKPTPDNAAVPIGFSGSLVPDHASGLH
jgi:hypothetical protein